MAGRSRSGFRVSRRGRSPSGPKSAEAPNHPGTIRGRSSTRTTPGSDRSSRRLHPAQPRADTATGLTFSPLVLRGSSEWSGSGGVMSKSHWRRLRRRALVVVPFALLAAACSATGGGSIPSQIPLSATDRATFGFTIESLDPVTGAGTWSGSYHDPHGITDFGPLDVRFKGTGKTHRCNTDPLCMKLAPPTKGLCI